VAVGVLRNGLQAAVRSTRGQPAAYSGDGSLMGQCRQPWEACLDLLGFDNLGQGWLAGVGGNVKACTAHPQGRVAQCRGGLAIADKRWRRVADKRRRR
jgi:hypothetical protein